MPWAPKTEEQRQAELRAQLRATSQVKLQKYRDAWPRTIAAYERSLPGKRNPQPDLDAMERMRVDVGILEEEFARRAGLQSPPVP